MQLNNKFCKTHFSKKGIRVEEPYLVKALVLQLLQAHHKELYNLDLEVIR